MRQYYNVYIDWESVDQLLDMLFQASSLWIM